MNMDINMNASHPTSDTYIPNMMPFDATNRSEQHLYPDYVQHPHYSTNTNYYYPYINPAPANPYDDGVVPMSGYPMYMPEMVKVEDGVELAAAAQIGLNLGHRTYFSSGDSLAIDRLFRRSRGFYQVTQQAPRCQAEGCKADLSGAKHYHRRHKVCEYHSKATVVVAAGLHQRFCQQCSRFHVLSEFDEAKRSCRKRLADHNRRRRKPQPGTTPASATRDPSPATNNSTTSSIDETKQAAQNTTSQHLCTSSSTDCLNKDHNSKANSKTTFLRNGPALSLGGPEDGRFGLQNTTPLYQNRPFAVMSDEESSHYPQNHHHHHMSPSSSSATFFQPRRGFFCSNSNDASRAASGSGSTAQDNRQSSLLNHGHGLFEVDFM